jgi:hypothetical protein
VEDDGVGLGGQTNGEILVQYGVQDPLGIFLGWGFASETEPFALSLAMNIRKAGLVIRRAEPDHSSKPVPFFPKVTRDGATVYLSFLMLGHRNGPGMARGIFNRIMRDARVTEAGDLFDFILHGNRMQWLKLLSACEQAAAPLARMVRTLACAQLEAMSYSIGARDL